MQSTKWLKWLIPLAIFAIALFTRTYRLPETFLFGADEEYQITYARTISEDFHVVWIGVSAANTGFYLGPFWTYLTAGIIHLSSGDPLATGYFAALLGAITATIIYFLGKDLLNRRVGIIASILYALSPLVVYFDQKYWNPSSLPLLSLLLLYSALKIRDNSRWLYLFAVSVGLIFHVHLSLIPVALTLSIYSFRYIISLKWHKLIIALVLFLLTISPLIVFDYYHNYSNITAPLRWSEISSELSSSNIDNTERALFMIGRLWHLQPGLSSASEARPPCDPNSTTTPYATVVILGLIPLIVFTLARSTRHNHRKRGILIAFFALILPFIFYPGHNYEYYLLGAIPLYFLIVASTLSRFKSYVIFIILTIFAILAGQTLHFSNPLYGLEAKKQLIHNTTTYLDGADFALVEHGTCHRYEGWRYLYTIYGDYPLRSSMDNSYGWLYPAEISSKQEDYLIDIYGTGPIPTLDAQYFYHGGFTAIITKL